jgi:hypothetical protein
MGWSHSKQHLLLNSLNHMLLVNLPKPALVDGIQHFETTRWVHLGAHSFDLMDQ